MTELQDLIRRRDKRAKMIDGINQQIEQFKRHVKNLCEKKESCNDVAVIDNIINKIINFENHIINYQKQVLIESEYLCRLNSDIKSLGGE